MILICGGIADTVTELVCARLAACNYPFRLLDLGSYPSSFQISCRWNGSTPTGMISGPGWKLDLDDITGVYVRYLGNEGRASIKDIDRAAISAMYSELDAGLMALFEGLNCMVVNRLAGGMSNNSKTYQAMLIQQCGLKTPPTLVTNDPIAARNFIEENNGEVVYKSLSGIRSIVHRVDPRKLKRLKLLRNGPAQFQSFIPGDNIRVHTLGDELFATKILSESVDYRYAGREDKSVEMEAVRLTPAIAEACRQIARRLGLVLTGIDLKRTPEGEYFCFEVNPCPGFIYYERSTGQQISKALADLLQLGHQ